MIDDKPPSELIILHIDSNPEVFEKWVMLRMLCDPTFALKCCNAMFFDSQGRPARSFGDPKCKTLAWASASYHYMKGPFSMQSDGRGWVL